MEILVHSSKIHAPVEDVFNWHIREGAFERLNPPWQPFSVVGRINGIKDGGLITIRIPIGPLKLRWISQHCDYVERKQFADVMLKGPFKSWKHIHLFSPSEEESFSRIQDRIEYSLPFGSIFNRKITRHIIKNRLDILFNYRYQNTKQDISDYNKYKHLGSLNILISGSTGFIGSHLTSYLSAQGHKVTHLLRSTSKSNVSGIIGNILNWDPAGGYIDPIIAPNTIEIEKEEKEHSTKNKTQRGKSKGSCFDSVINLAGENVFGRWTKEKKNAILQSRIQSTELLCKSLASLDRPPKVLISASAIGYYGSNREDEILSEDDSTNNYLSHKDDFLAQVCKRWEQATTIAKEAGIRVVNIRIGVVMDPSGGILATILPVFKAGLGGKIGNGKQWISWIALDDLLSIILHIISNKHLSGPVNAVSPSPVTNADLTKMLGRILSRPSGIPVPSIVVRKVFGEFADATLLSSARIKPTKLLEAGYEFRFPNLEFALKHSLGKMT
jgi:uncharacterized protein